jgi:hypothetical protein
MFPGPHSRLPKCAERAQPQPIIALRHLGHAVANVGAQILHDEPLAAVGARGSWYQHGGHCDHQPSRYFLHGHIQSYRMAGAHNLSSFIVKIHPSMLFFHHFYKSRTLVLSSVGTGINEGNGWLR